MNPVTGALVKYLGGENISGSAGWDLFVSVTEKRTLLGGSPEIRAVLVLREETLFLQEIRGTMDRFIRENKWKGNPRVYWFLLSSRGGIYLHEAVTGDPAWKKDPRRNRLCVINPGNGTVCLRPGHIQNRVISERTAFLLGQYRFSPPEVWEKEIRTVFDVCLACMAS